MSAPKRWLDETGSEDSAARELLRSGSSLDPPPGAQAQVWAALVAQLPPGAPGGGGSGSGGAGGGALPAGAGKAALAGGGMLKSALIGAGSALALITAYAVVTPPSAPEPAPPAPQLAVAETSVPARRPSAPRPPPTVDPAPSAAPSAPAPAEPRAAELHGNGSAAPSADPAPIVDPGSEASAAEKESRIREESQRLAEARDTLRRGDAPGALARLDELRRRFPTGMLVQEREALAIEALSRSGNGGEARARAEAFKKSYPASPHAARIDALTGEPPPR